MRSLTEASPIVLAPLQPPTPPCRPPHRHRPRHHRPPPRRRRRPRRHHRRRCHPHRLSPRPHRPSYRLRPLHLRRRHPLRPTLHHLRRRLHRLPPGRNTLRHMYRAAARPDGTVPRMARGAASTSSCSATVAPTMATTSPEGFRQVRVCESRRTARAAITMRRAFRCSLVTAAVMTLVAVTGVATSIREIAAAAIPPRPANRRGATVTRSPISLIRVVGSTADPKAGAESID